MGKNGECCMCGDQGLSSELFTCKTCKFRSQHKYCSNLYPGAESYHICNWCLSQAEDKTRQGKTQTSYSPNSSSHKPTKSSDLDDGMKKMDKKKRVLLVDSIHGDHTRTTAASSGQIKKQINREPEAAPAGPSGRKRVPGGGGGGGGGGIIRRTRSDVTSSNGGNRMIIKHVFRNKVRRYKLLDEVST